MKDKKWLYTYFNMKTHKIVNYFIYLCKLKKLASQNLTCKIYVRNQKTTSIICSRI